MKRDSTTTNEKLVLNPGICEYIAIKKIHSPFEVNVRANKNTEEYYSRTFRLQLYMRVLKMMINDPGYISNGFFDQGICGFINACSDEVVKIKHLPELYKQRPWWVFFRPRCHWWKLNKRTSAMKRLRVIKKAIDILQSELSIDFG